MTTILNSDRQINDLKFHIAIIDDDPIMQLTLTDIIKETINREKYEYDISSYKDGMEFFNSNKQLESGLPCLIILDIIMPNMNGFEVLQKLRSLPNEERFSIMLLSSSNKQEDIRKAVHLEADDFLTKPLQKLNFKLRLLSLLKRMKT